jgi:hypothetical protein
MENRIDDLSCMTPAMAIIFSEIKLVTHMTIMTVENRNKANNMLNEIRDNTRLMASDSFEDHQSGNCHCIMAINATERLAEFLRALKKENKRKVNHAVS